MAAKRGVAAWKESWEAFDDINFWSTIRPLYIRFSAAAASSWCASPRSRNDEARCPARGSPIFERVCCWKKLSVGCYLSIAVSSPLWSSRCGSRFWSTENCASIFRRGYYSGGSISRRLNDRKACVAAVLRVNVGCWWTSPTIVAGFRANFPWLLHTPDEATA